MAIAGVPATAFEMARTLQASFEFYRRSQLQQMSLKAKIRALSRLLRDNLPATLQGFGIVQPIFAGVEVDDPTASRRFSFTIRWGRSSKRRHMRVPGRVRQHQERAPFPERWGNPKPAEMSVEQAVAWRRGC